MSRQRGDVAFVFSNPRHHLEMMRPVMAELGRRGRAVQAVSLAELRGFRTPEVPEATAVHRVIPAHLRRSPSAGASLGGEGSGRSGRLARRLIMRLVWRAGLAPRLRHLVGGSRALVVPNDAAFPYRELVEMVRGRDIPFLLMQEGVRFPLPGVAQADAYGRGGAAVVCAWGEASAEYFRAQGVPPGSIEVTGNPRFDDIDLAGWRGRGQALCREHRLERPPLLYMSNPIDDQGFCSTGEKLSLFEGFADQAAPILEREQTHLMVKLHPREDVAGFRQAAARTAAAARTIVLDDAPLFAVLAAARAAVVLTSTVGLEALLFRVPLGALAIPQAGFAFDYVSSGAAVGLTLGPELPGGLERLLAGKPGVEPEPVRAYLHRHLAHRGESARRIADHLDAVIERRASGAARRSA